MDVFAVWIVIKEFLWLRNNDNFRNQNETTHFSSFCDCMYS